MSIQASVSPQEYALGVQHPGIPCTSGSMPACNTSSYPPGSFVLRVDCIFVIFPPGQGMAKAWLLTWDLDESYTYKLRILTCVYNVSYVWSQGWEKRGCG